MSTIEEQIEAAKKRLEQLKERKLKFEAKKQSTERERTRKAENRRKTLVGAAVLAKPDMTDERLKAMMNPFLKRDDERALFGLSPLPKAVATNPANQPERAAA